MLLTLTVDRPPERDDLVATDVGFLLHKHPDRVHHRALAYGDAHVLTAEATAERCVVALMLTVDPVALVRGRGGRGRTPALLSAYVNDRPYVASSLLSVAMAELFRSALGGRCAQRPELVDVAWPVTVHLPVVPARGGVALLRRLFEPLGYEVTVEGLPLDETQPAWGASSLVDLVLRHTLPIRDLLRHLYVLVPVLDDDKHYWVGDAEVDKLVRRGEGWLADHPEREQVALRYLKRRRSLARRAVARLAPVAEEEANPAPQARVARAPTLQAQRIAWVAEQVRALGARTVADVGCGEGQLLKALLWERTITRLVGVDVSTTALERCERRLKLDERAPAIRDRVELLHSALGWRDDRLDGLDLVALVEVIEHIDEERLPDVVGGLFGANRPRHVVVTTPNAEHNVLYEALAAGEHRHVDHRFEWDRPTFRDWARGVASTHDYRVDFADVGPVHAVHGAPTQAAIFTFGGAPCR